MLLAGRVLRQGQPARSGAGHPGNENPELPTGEIEVAADELDILGEGRPAPVPDRRGGGDRRETRLRYRYLDMRRPETSTALRVRSEATYLVTDVLRSHRFVYVETPDLTRSTPEGARDFLVPVRLKPGHWYALPQSPQLFKQLLMVGGMERYWQLARCFRDEDFRADRQPEFTQIDIEMSFVTREDVVEVAEDLVARLWAEVAAYELPRPVPQMTYAEAMARFGSDKPDLRSDRGGVGTPSRTNGSLSTPSRSRKTAGRPRAAINCRTARHARRRAWIPSMPAVPAAPCARFSSPARGCGRC